MNFTLESHNSCECMAFFYAPVYYSNHFPENRMYSEGVYPLMEKI
jgi:hypothetical protein